MFLGSFSYCWKIIGYRLTGPFINKLGQAGPKWEIMSSSGDDQAQYNSAAGCKIHM